MATHTVTVEREQGELLCARCVLADRPWTRLRGLMGRKRLAADEGLLLRPAGAIHTMFMRFPIDAVFLNHENLVVKVVADLRPWRFAGARRARSVLELPAGAAERARLSAGETLVVVPDWLLEAA